ncbi:MAG: hypothetical protein CSA42_05650 [Gammaproteobacteria bacterium]|nr:MAG: hypothetical protein CSA42_05650 [Gammaproteobacteria bacterium]
MTQTTTKTYLSKKTLVVTLGVLMSQAGFANNELPNTQPLEQYNQQRNQALQQQLQTNPTVHLDSKPFQAPAIKPNTNNTPNTPCFDIHSVSLANNPKGVFDFALKPYLAGNESVIGQCLNIDDINQLVSNVQNNIIDKGYVTTRVVISNQNIASGNLVLDIIPGYIAQIKANKLSDNLVLLDDGEPINFATAFAIEEGQLLNIRDIEQGLENFKRVPSADANFAIAPSSDVSVPGYSDLLIDYTQGRRWRVSAGIDDSGQKSTGQYQANVTLSLDNPMWHNDLFYVSYGHSLDGASNDVDDDSWNYNIGYTLPIDNSLLSITHNGYNYKQTVAGASEDYTYSGDSYNTEAMLSHLVHRDSHSKTYVKGGAFTKKQRNYIDDTEVEVQRRKTSGWKGGIAYETTVNGAQISSELMYQHGTGAFNALTPTESLFNEGSARAGIIKTNVDVNKPFELAGKQFNYHGLFKGQLAEEALVPADRFSIGGRYTVRGYDGERTLSGDHGALLRQDVTMMLGESAHGLYAGVDAGYVQMDNKIQDKQLLGHHLVGAAVGAKGYVKPLKTTYDVFAGFPVDSPESFADKDVVAGFSLGWQY